jgi:quercetin dioxygenase-like cupin family protein
MKVRHYETVEARPVEMEGSRDCLVRWLVGERDGAPNFAMRQFEVRPGGHTPRHAHPYEHEVFVLEGSGEVLEGSTAHDLSRGDVVFIKPNEVHQFRNPYAEPLKFLCLIPNSAQGQQVTVVPECGIDPRTA